MLAIVSEMDGGWTEIVWRRAMRVFFYLGRWALWRSFIKCMFQGGNCLGRKTAGSLSWTLIWVRLNQLTLQTGGYNERVGMKTSFLSSDNYFPLKHHFSSCCPHVHALNKMVSSIKPHVSPVNAHKHFLPFIQIGGVKCPYLGPGLIPSSIRDGSSDHKS